MRHRTKHSSAELLVRVKIALGSSYLIELAESHCLPNGAQTAAHRLGKTGPQAYSIWALSALKRDYPVIYANLPEIIQFRKSRTAPTGTAKI